MTQDHFLKENQIDDNLKDIKKSIENLNLYPYK